MSEVVLVLLVFAVSVCVAVWFLWRRRRQLVNVGREPLLPTDKEAASSNAPVPESQISSGVLPGQDLERSVKFRTGTSELSPQDVDSQRALHASMAASSGRSGHQDEQSESPDVDLQRALEASIADTCGHGHQAVIATADITFKNALTGEPLDVGSIDLILHVAVARECIAKSMGVGDVRLLDAEGHILKDCDILGQLGVSEIGVSFAKKNRMTVEALRARFQGLTVCGASFATCNGIYVPDDPFKESTMYRNQDCQSAVISSDGCRWTLRMDGSILYSYNSKELPRDGLWRGACDDGTSCQVSHRGAGTRCGSLRRLATELREFDHPGCTAQLADTEIDNALDEQLLCWRISMPGPEGANFELLVRFPTNYPWLPPEVWFVTQIDHWSVRPDGKMLMDILDNMWSPALGCRTIIASIHAVLLMPSPS